MIRLTPFKSTYLLCVAITLLLSHSAGAASSDEAYPAQDVCFSASEPDMVWITEPYSRTVDSKWNTVIVTLPEDIPYQDSLVIKGSARVESANLPKHLGVVVLNAKGQGGFAKAGFQADGEADFTIRLNGLKLDPKYKESPFADGQGIHAIKIYASFDQAEESSFTLESMSISQSALFQGTFSILPQWQGVHPRLYADESEIEAAARHYREDPSAFSAYLPAKHEMDAIAKPLETTSVTQWGSMVLAKFAVAYRLTGDKKYLDCFKQWLPVLQAYEPPVMKSIGGGTGLTAGHILLGLSISYDVLKGHADEEVVSTLRDVLIRQGDRTYADLTSMGSYPYEQNHFIIPVCGLGVAAMTLCDEVPQAKQWGVFTTNVMQRTLNCIAHDGWFFEGHSYWNYTMQFPAAYAAAGERLTGVDYFAKPPFKDTAKYLAHITQPTALMVFDFADWGPRVSAGGGAQGSYHTAWHSPGVYARIKMFIPYLIWREGGHDPFLYDFMESVTPEGDNQWTGAFAIDSVFGMLLQMPVSGSRKRMKTAYEGYPPYHYFDDMEVLHWRENWSDSDVTSIAFKSGPPAGHHFTDELAQNPGAKPSLGHAHPDAGSFLLFSRGVYLSNDTGYTGKKETADHNSILIDGIGQHKGGTAWGTFAGKPYAEYNKIHMENVWLGPLVIAGTADFTAAYDDALGVTGVQRDLIMVDGRFLVVRDRLQAKDAHEYSWRLHMDKEPVADGSGRYLMENGPARLVIAPLAGVGDVEIAPTLVETQVYAGEPSRPQQRGFHLAVSSEKKPDWEFLTAFHIEGIDESPQAFFADALGDNCVDMEDAQGGCTLWAGPGDGLDGHFAYLLRNADGAITAVGLEGTSLKTPDLTLTIPSGGSVTLRLSPAGIWEMESGQAFNNGGAVTLQVAGGEKQSFMLAAQGKDKR